MTRLLPLALSLLVCLPLPALAAPLKPYWVVELSQRDDSGLFFDWFDAGFTAKDVDRDGIISDSEVFDSYFSASQARTAPYEGELTLQDTTIGAPQVSAVASGWQGATCFTEVFFDGSTGRRECLTIVTVPPFGEYIDEFVPEYERFSFGLTFDARWTHVVPLPPAGFLLLGALAGMALVGRRARRGRAAA